MASFNKQKAFGQHFLNDSGVIQTIIKESLKALESNPDHALLEIGPGEGALTKPMMEALGGKIPFYLAERDRELISFWKPEPRIVRILEGDFLSHPPELLKEISPFVVMSNLPYSAGTGIVIMLAEMKAIIPEMILMFQAEVAKRIYSPPSTPDRGSLSLYIQNEWDVKKLIAVKLSSFTPPPKVMSEVIRLKRRAEPHINVDEPQNREFWNELLKTSFKQRRKMLRGNLAGTRWQKGLEKGGVDPTKRAESLNWDEWKAIWKNSF